MEAVLFDFFLVLFQYVIHKALVSLLITLRTQFFLANLVC